MLAQLRAYPREQYGKLEWFCDVVVGACIKPQNGVGIGRLGRQHDDRTTVSILPHDLARLAAIKIRHVYIQNDQINELCLEMVDCG